MGGLPWDVAARDLPVPEAISQRRAALGIPQATPRAQEAPPQAAKRGQGQACGDGQTAPDTQDQSTKTSKLVYNIISTQGWVRPACQDAPDHSISATDPTAAPSLSWATLAPGPEIHRSTAVPRITVAQTKSMSVSPMLSQPRMTSPWSALTMFQNLPVIS